MSNETIDDTASSPAPSREDHMACQLAQWYPVFSAPFPGRKKGLTFQSRILEAPNSFRFYLTEDGVRLPANTKASSCLGCRPRATRNVTGYEDADDDDNDSWSNDSSDNSAADHDQNKSAANHPELTQWTDTVTNAIRELGGTVIPKLNWSAPKDASWMNEGTLKCTTAGDVYLLLKSSDFVSSDLNLVESLQHPPTEEGNENIDSNNNEMRIQLILRKWANLFPSQEFRCFVKNHRLIGVSQRHADQHFEHLPQEKNELLVLLEDFLMEAQGNDSVVNAFQLSNFVVDVYVDRQDRAWLVDFNVWGERTDSLLFDWKELRNWAEDRASEIRVVETEKEVCPHPLNNFRAPIDTVHIASITSGNADSFQAFVALCRTQEEKE